VFRKAHQDADVPHPGSLLPARRKWPRRRAAEQGEEFAPSHSITSSARSMIDDGTVRPRLCKLKRAF
jgi:hypothetical protein